MQRSELLSPQFPTACITEESWFRPTRQLSSNSSDEETALNLSTRYDRSPSPCSSIDSYPAPSSPPLPSVGATDSDSDDYSPVCSEADPNEFPVDLEDMTEFNVKATPVEEFEDDEDGMFLNFVLFSVLKPCILNHSPFLAI